MSVKKNNSAESAEVTIARYLRMMLSAGVMIYLFLILAVMPFYNREGYNHIGSDKSYFFRTCTGNAAKLLMVVLVPYWVCLAIGFWHRTAGLPIRQRLRTGIRSLRLNVTDICAICYAGVVAVSYLCSDYQETALLGTSGWYMGMAPQLMLVGIYFFASRFCQKPVWLAWLALAASAVVYVLGYLNRFDIWPLAMDSSGLPEFISTIGNINWYGGYLAAVFSLGIGMLLAEGYPGGSCSCTCHSRVRSCLTCAILGAYVFLGFLAVVTNGSASLLFTVAVMVYLGYCGIGLKGDPRLLRRFWLVLLLLGGAGTLTMILRLVFPGRINLTYEVVNLMTWSPLPVLILAIAALVLLLLTCGKRADAVAARAMQLHRMLTRIALVAGPVCLIAGIAMLFVNTIRPGSLGALSDLSIFTFNRAWGSARGGTWELGFRCFWEQNFLHKLVGVGPDCMVEYLYGGSEELTALTERYFEGARLTNAHGELITLLANVGILGAASYMEILISAAVRFLRRGQANGLLLGAGLCVLAYLLNGTWSFQQSMGAATMFAVLGIGEAKMRTRLTHIVK